MEAWCAHDHRPSPSEAKPHRGASHNRRPAETPVTRMDKNNAPINILELAEGADELWFRDELAYAWRDAQDEAIAAYEAWCESPGPDGYAVYRAAEDRADQAQEVLARKPPMQSDGG
jgi:hypothetical protein